MLRCARSESGYLDRCLSSREGINHGPVEIGGDARGALVVVLLDGGAGPAAEVVGPRIGEGGIAVVVRVPVGILRRAHEPQEDTYQRG